jgi:hypothetical protein
MYNGPPIDTANYVHVLLMAPLTTHKCAVADKRAVPATQHPTQQECTKGKKNILKWRSGGHGG